MSKKRRRRGERPSFDPSQMRASPSLFESAEADAQDRPAPGKTERNEATTDRLTVSQLATLIDQTLKVGMPAKVSVIGEISGLKDQTHWYFRLKDADAVVDCVMFASAVRRQRVTVRDGDEVVARGRVEHYARQGRTQLYVDRIEPVGAGSLERRFKELCEELRALGWFEPERKRPLPRFPRRVAVVTSRTGAAIQDVIDTFGRRAPFIPLVVADVRVQGEQAAQAIANMVQRLNREQAKLGIDAILLTRGGGSIEDLWAFNERVVAQAIVESRIPVVAAIGHESDTTVAELVADERAATPTQAAMRLSPDREALQEQIEMLATRSTLALTRRISHERERIRGIARHPIISQPAAVVQDHRSRLRERLMRLNRAVQARTHQSQLEIVTMTSKLAAQRPHAVLAQASSRVDELERRLHSTMRDRTGAARSSLRERARTLEATGPMNVLRRGYSVTRRADGRVIQSAADAAKGDLIETLLADGRIVSTVGEHDAPDDAQDHDASSLFDPS